MDDFLIIATTAFEIDLHIKTNRVLRSGASDCSVGSYETHPIVSTLIKLVRFAFGSPDGISQLASKIYKHLFLAFVFSDDWCTSTYVSNVAYFTTVVASFVSIGAVFSLVVGFIFSTASACLVWHVFLSTDELF